MDVLIYNKYAKLLRRYPQGSAPTLSELKVQNPVIAFDQSTTCSGVTIGDDKGNIHGYLRLIKSNSNEVGTTYIANFQEWLRHFIDVPPAHMLYEDTYSKSYFRTDVILSQLRGVFTTLEQVCNWKFPITKVPQQDWKSCVIALKDGDHSLTKDNAHYVILEILLPQIDKREDYDDLYDSIGIYYFYTRHLMDIDLSKPVDVTKKLKIRESAQFVYAFCVGKEPNLHQYNRIMQNRGIRYFNYTKRMTPFEHASRLASNSNDFWICKVPFNDNPHIDQILPMCDRLPGPEEYIYLVCYRTNKGKFNKRIL